MMPMKTRDPNSINGKIASAAAAASAGGDNEWEVRPGGMLVQKRDPNDEQTRIPPPTIRVRVKYGSVYHEINISSQATFGELKKMLSGPTGLHHEDQKVMYKNKERSSKTYLDFVGVKDRSKMVVVEDPISQEKRYIEMRNNAKMEKAAKFISEISLEVDRLAGQVSALESVISKGGKVAEKTMLNLIELLMNQLLKLDGIMAEGDVKLQRKMQVKRVQKYVETLDVLKVKNSIQGSNANESQVPKQQPPSVQVNHEQRHSNGPGGVPERNVQHNHNKQAPFPKSRRSVGNFVPIPAPSKPQQEPSRSSASSSSGEVVVTTQWETFDSMPTAPPPPQSSTTNAVHHPKFSWDLL